MNRKDYTSASFQGNYKQIISGDRKYLAVQVWI